MTDIHTTLAANPWPTIRDPMPRANALGNELKIGGVASQSTSEIGTTSLQRTRDLPPSVSIVWRFHCKVCYTSTESCISVPFQRGPELKELQYEVPHNRRKINCYWGCN